MLFERYLAQQSGPGVVSAVTPTVNDEITNRAKKTVLKEAPPFVDDTEDE
jgi:hypothetical protein